MHCPTSGGLLVQAVLDEIGNASARGQFLYRLETEPSGPKGYYAVRTVPGFDVLWRESELMFRLT